VPVAQEVGSVNGAAGFFTASASVLAFREGAEGAGQQLTWFDRQGKVLGTVGDRATMQRPSISPDGRMVAIDRRDPQTGLFDIWLYDLTRGTASRLTSNSANNRFPLWSPDGSHVAYGTAGGPGGVVQKAASGVGQEDVLDTERQRRTLDWSRDGRYLIESALDPKTGRDIWALPLFGDRKPFALLHSGFNLLDNAKLSRDGRWLAYVSDETGRNEVYVQTFPNPGGKWPVSTAGGDLPVWSRDGKELFFVGADQKMMAVEVKGGPSAATFEVGVPKTLFDVHMGAIISPGFDVSADSRFLVPTNRLEQTATTPITVVLNWTAALK
jgi:eukaryotic-like serine/threonine-protein kinase